MTPEWIEEIKKRVAFIEDQELPPALVTYVEKAFIRDNYARPYAALYANSLLDIPDLLQLIEKWREALNQIAAWDDGPVVTGSFDHPGPARTAREALNYKPEGR